MGDQQKRPAPVVECCLELFDGREIEVISWLVQHEAIVPLAMRTASSARVRSPGESVANRPSTSAAPRPNFASSERALGGPHLGLA